MVGHLEGKRNWAHFKFLSGIYILLTGRRGNKRSMLVTYWNNKGMKRLNLADGLRSHLNQ